MLLQYYIRLEVLIAFEVAGILRLVPQFVHTKLNFTNC